MTLDLVQSPHFTVEETKDPIWEGKGHSIKQVRGPDPDLDSRKQN